MGDEAQCVSDLSGLIEEGSEYDSEEDKKEARQTKKRKAAEEKATKARKPTKKKRSGLCVRKMSQTLVESIPC